MKDFLVLVLPVNLSGKTSQMGGMRRERVSGRLMRADDKAKTKISSFTRSRTSAATFISSSDVFTPKITK